MANESAESRVRTAWPGAKWFAECSPFREGIFDGVQDSAHYLGFDWEDAAAKIPQEGGEGDTEEKCGQPAGSFHPRLGLCYACVLPKNHEGEHKRGGCCWKHGAYMGEQCPQWPSCVDGEPPALPTAGGGPDTFIRCVGCDCPVGGSRDCVAQPSVLPETHAGEEPAETTPVCSPALPDAKDDPRWTDPDWDCPKCQTTNKAIRKRCRNCGTDVDVVLGGEMHVYEARLGTVALPDAGGEGEFSEEEYKQAARELIADGLMRRWGISNALEVINEKRVLKMYLGLNRANAKLAELEANAKPSPAPIQERLLDAEHQVRHLASLIVDIAVRLGITKGDMPLSGSEVSQLGGDILLALSPAPQRVPEEIREAAREVKRCLYGPVAIDDELAEQMADFILALAEPQPDSKEVADGQ